MANQIVDWLTLIAIIITFVISINHLDKTQLLPIQIYIFLSIVFNLIIKITDLLPQQNSTSNIAHIAINVFSLLEISLIYYYLYFRIRGRRFRKTIVVFYLLYFTICGIFWNIKPNSFYSFAPHLFGIEGVLITIPCLFYIYEILRTDLKVNLYSNANFIVTCGILFYFSISIPTYLSWYNLYYLAPGFDKLLLLSNSIFYGILFISFMKAYLCNIQEQKQ